MRRLTLLVLAFALVLSACGGGDDPAENPQESLDAALDNLSEYEGVDLLISIASTPESLAAMDENGEMSEEDAQKILDSSIAIKGKGDGEDGQVEVIVNVAGRDNAIELKAVAQTLYARADVEGLVEEFDGDPAQIEQARQEMGSAPGFEFVNAAIDGEWIALRGYEEALEQFTGASQEEPTDEQRDAVERFVQALKESSTVTAGDEDGPGTHLIASIPLREAYEEFQGLAGELGQGLAGTDLPDAGEIPDENVTIDTWVDGDRLTQIEFDFLQVSDIVEGEDIPEGVEEFALRVEIDEFTDDVQAPEDAVEVDLMQLMQQFMGGMGGDTGGDTGGGGGMDDICAQLEAELEGQPDEVIEQVLEVYGEQCPNLGG